MKMPFGKYKGTELTELLIDDPYYIVWLAENCKLHGDLKEFITEHYRVTKNYCETNDEYIAGCDCTEGDLY